MTVTFALNRTCAPQLTLAEFVALAQAAGVGAVEIRNDIHGREFADGISAAELKARLSDAGLELASVNALQRFNDWTPARAEEARRLIGYSAELGAPGVVLCPAHQPGDDQQADPYDRLCEGGAEADLCQRWCDWVCRASRDAPFIHETPGSGHRRAG